MVFMLRAAQLVVSGLTATTFVAASACTAINGYPPLGSGGDDAAGGTSASGGSGGEPSVGGEGGTSGGMAPTCDEAICAAMCGECESCTCIQGVFCDTDPLSYGSPCSLGYCSDGLCRGCLDNTNFPCADTSQSCDQFICVTAECDDGTLNGLESDLDCGGPDCAPCNTGATCVGPNDCQTSYCAGSVCANCTLQTDCASDMYCDGGSCRNKKNLFDMCTEDYECLSGNCSSFGMLSACAS
jgi:hypothetical protein